MRDMKRQREADDGPIITSLLCLIKKSNVLHLVVAYKHEKEGEWIITLNTHTFAH